MFTWLSLSMQRFPIVGPIFSAGVAILIIFSCWRLGLLSMIGDFVAQQGIERKSWHDHDLKRTLRFAIYGFSIIVWIVLFFLLVSV